MLQNEFGRMKKTVQLINLHSLIVPLLCGEISLMSSYKLEKIDNPLDEAR
jgi:hypothetical protein